MRLVPSSRAAVVPVAVLACLLAASGCAGNDDSPAPSAAADPTATAPTEPAGPTSTPPTPTDSATPADPNDRLLATEEVPGLNAKWTWQDGETGPAGPDPFGVCAKADLASIGATEVVERTWFPPDDSDDNAAEQVAEFPDQTTASTAWTVLKAWHDRCAAPADSSGFRARALESVPVTAGAARWYLLSWQPADDEAGRFEGLGMVRSGTRIAVLRIDHSGPDHDYAPGQDPMIGMVRAAAARLD
jgi:hypothetical protein